MLRILVISRTPWRNDNSFGNTASNLFDRMEDVDIANICLADGLPFENKNVSRYFHVSEKSVANSIFKEHSKENSIGGEVYPILQSKESIVVKDKSLFARAVKYGKQHQTPLFFLLREVIWKYGNIGYDDMINFIKDYKPDVIFSSMYYAGYVNRVMIEIHKTIKIPIVLSAGIDVYTLKQISFDPFYWINRFYVRYKTRQIAKISDLLYVISEKQKKDYQRIFSLPIKVKYKIPDKSRSQYDYIKPSRPVRYFYAGNLGLGRWKSLALLVKVLKQTGNGFLDIYTQTLLNDNQLSLLNVEGVCVVHPPISQDDVIRLQNAADVLVHVESFNLKNKLEVRYAISTKIMDYISVGRCILAIGPSDIASMMYLNERNLAYIVSDDENLFSIVKQLNTSETKIIECAERNKQYVNSINADYVIKQIRQDLIDVSKKNRSEL
mgnify:CR=1 FL=1